MRKISSHLQPVIADVLRDISSADNHYPSLRSAFIVSTEADAIEVADALAYANRKALGEGMGNQEDRLGNHQFIWNPPAALGQRGSAVVQLNHGKLRWKEVANHMARQLGVQPSDMAVASLANEVIDVSAGAMPAPDIRPETQGSVPVMIGHRFRPYAILPPEEFGPAQTKTSEPPKGNAGSASSDRNNDNERPHTERVRQSRPSKSPRGDSAESVKPATGAAVVSAQPEEPPPRRKPRFEPIEGGQKAGATLGAVLRQREEDERRR